VTVATQSKSQQPQRIFTFTYLYLLLPPPCWSKVRIIRKQLLLSNCCVKCYLITLPYLTEVRAQNPSNSKHATQKQWLPAAA